MRTDAQALARAVLDDAIPDAAVRVSVPNPRPDRLVLVRREGGAMADRYRDKPGIGVFCWAATEEAACALASAASEAMLSMELLDGVASVVEEVLASSPDPEDKTPRWYGSYTLTTYKRN